MTIIATCGHEISNEWDYLGKGHIIIESEDIYGSIGTDSIVVCSGCLELYKGYGIIIG